MAPRQTQLLMLSGSVANPKHVVSWLQRLGRDAKWVWHDERPVPLEEVYAGILNYNKQRKKTNNKLEKVSDNLLRVNDIISEIEKNLKTLNLQMKRYSRHESLLVKLKEKELSLLVGDEAKDLLAINGYSPREGARKLRRQVEVDLEEPMAEIILKGDVQKQDTIVVSTNGNEFTFDVIKSIEKKKKKKEKKS